MISDETIDLFAVSPYNVIVAPASAQQPVSHQMAREIQASRKLVALVRRWTSDHNMNGKPCHCLLCTGLERYERETAA